MGLLCQYFGQCLFLTLHHPCLHATSVVLKLLPRVALPQVSAATAPQERGKPLTMKSGEDRLPASTALRVLGQGWKLMVVVAQGVLLVPVHATLRTPCSNTSGFRWPPRPDLQGTTKSTPPQPSSGLEVRTEDHLHGFSMPASAQIAPSHLQRAARLGHGQSLKRR